MWWMKPTWPNRHGQHHSNGKTFGRWFVHLSLTSNKKRFIAISNPMIIPPTLFQRMILVIAIMGCGLSETIQASVDAGPAGLPNILIVLVDDMGYGDPTCYNPESRLATPNIDSLAHDGMLFVDAHAPGPLCHMTERARSVGINKQHAVVSQRVDVRRR